MKFIHPEIDSVFDTECGLVHSLIIENQLFMRKLLQDLHSQTEGFVGDSVLSLDNQPISISKYAEVLGAFIPFDINRKTFTAKIASALEKSIAASEHYVQAGEVLRSVMEFLDAIAFDFPCDIVFPKLSMSGIIKSASPEVRDEYESLAEKVLDYIELVETFDKRKLFFTVNLRSFLSDDETERFMKSILSHGYNVIMIESGEHTRLPMEQRLVIDQDLCEIG